MTKVVRLLLLAASLVVSTALPSLADDRRTDGGMLDWPRDEMVRALGIFVPEKMQVLGVPGVSIAVVDGGRIVYTGTFGRADEGAKMPVTPSTRFKADEFGETVAAYAAMSMMRDKLLFLDAPLSRDLPKPWLRDAEDDRAVTLREVLTHTSGLGDNVAHPSRVTAFKPGSRFAHSGVGFIYLQHVMEAVSGEPFGQMMAERVFRPLGMDDSFYEQQPDAKLNLARGYVPLGFLLSAFYLPFAIAFIVVFGIIWGLSHFTLQRRVEPIDMIWPAASGLVFAVGNVWWGFGLPHAIFIIGAALGYALCIAVLAGFFYYIAYLLGLARSRDGFIDRGRGTPESVIVAAVFVLALVAGVPTFGWTLRVPVLPFLPERLNAATSFRTTSADMARFMIEIMDGTQLGEETRNRMINERVPVGGPYFWCLGLGVRQDQTGETLWTRGSALGFESLMVMDPKRRAGVVVLTNSREGVGLAQRIANNVLGVEGVWTLP